MEPGAGGRRRHRGDLHPSYGHGRLRARLDRQRGAEGRGREADSGDARPGSRHGPASLSHPSIAHGVRVVLGPQVAFTNGRRFFFGGTFALRTMSGSRSLSRRRFIRSSVLLGGGATVVGATSWAAEHAGDAP